MRRLTLFLAVLVLFAAGACSKDDGGAVSSGSDATTTTKATTPEVHEVAIEAKEYSFGLPKEVKSGTVEFTLKNSGKELHIAALEKIKDGKTFSDATKDLQSSTPPADPASEELGGISSTSPGGTANFTVQLEPGSYFFACFIPAADGAPHAAKGMVQPFTVTEDQADPAPVPTAAGQVSAKEFQYTTTYKATAGSQVIELKNDGTQGHEITLIEFKDGKGPADLQAFFADTSKEPPATFYGGPAIAPGKTASWKTPALEAGKTYFFMCLIPDPADNVPHAAKGMVLPVQIT